VLLVAGEFKYEKGSLQLTLCLFPSHLYSLLCSLEVTAWLFRH